MYESGYYPAGAEHDPDAPWNKREPTMVECAACGGTGYHYYAYNFETDRDTSVQKTNTISSPMTKKKPLPKPVHHKGHKGTMRGVRW